MQHLAIDLGGKESQICVRDAKEKILEERKYPTKRLGEYLAKQPPSRVILETSAEAFAVADLARHAGHDVRVVLRRWHPASESGLAGSRPTGATRRF